MLQPYSDRLNYGDLLSPPEGFQFENAITTSYSLDLGALISIPVALYLEPSLSIDLKKDFIKVLDSIRKASDTVKVFCQKGQIKVPEKQHRLYSFIEPCVVQIPPTHNHSFHPKVWVLRYKNSYQEIRYRVIVLSRNLTLDRSWDVVFSLDGDVPIKKNSPKKVKNKPLIKFVEYLIQYDSAPWYKQFLKDLARTEFNLGLSPFEDFEFIPLGIDNTQPKLLGEYRYDEMLVISPFVTNGGLEIVKRHSSATPILISRENELQKISLDLLKQFDAWHLHQNFVQGEEKVESETQEDHNIQLQDIHAKVYCYKNGWDAFLLLGSANCSQRAMHKNVEFMLKLKGKNSKIGPAVLKKELIENDYHFFQQFDFNSTIEEESSLLQEHDQILQRARIDLASARLTATAIKQNDENYQIDFSYDLRSVTDKLEIKCYLINNEDQVHNLRAGGENSWSIKNLKELDLSSFIVIELSIKDSISRCSFALKIDIGNLPLARNTKIFRDIISNSSNFFKYIRFLLAENDSDELHSLENDIVDTSNEKGNQLNQQFALEEAIYENMLKAVSREPHKLNEIKDVMERLSQEEDSLTPIVPEDFKILWQIFESSRKN